MCVLWAKRVWFMIVLAIASIYEWLDKVSRRMSNDVPNKVVWCVYKTRINEETVRKVLFSFQWGNIEEGHLCYLLCLQLMQE